MLKKKLTALMTLCRQTIQFLIKTNKDLIFAIFESQICCQIVFCNSFLGSFSEEFFELLKFEH